MRPAKLRCEYRVNPLGIDETEPRLSWELDAVAPNLRGLLQSAYEIRVAENEAELRAARPLLWDSGKMVSGESNQVVYAGKPLSSGENVFWQVRVWDRNGAVSPWSSPARWSMGLLHPTDWTASWIGADESPSWESPESVFHNLEQAHWIGISAAPKHGGAVLFRTSFTIASRRHVKRAIFLMGADSRYEAFLNGQSIARGTFWRMPDFRDVTPDIVTGKNTLTVSVTGPGAKHPVALIGAIRIDFEGGQTQFVLTSPAWEASAKAAQDWASASDLGHYGAKPWGRVGFTEERALPARMLRHEFNVNAGLKRATAWVSGLGLYELWLDGKKVGDQVLSPGLTDYDKRVLYVTYDVTRELAAGRNAVGLILGNGRYWAPRALVPTDMRSFGYPKAICQIELEYNNGHRERVVTDASWKLTRHGPIRADNEYDGEFYDARRELRGWSTSGYDDSGWEPAHLVAPPAGRLVAQMAEPLRVVQSLHPVRVSEPQPGVFVFDMGQNMVGWCRLRVSGAPGTRVSLRFAETLTPHGMLYLDNLRSARALDTYVLKGGETEVWEPRFTYHGFRYVEVRGYPGKPPLSALEGRVVRDDMAQIADFHSSNDLLNRLHHNIVWGVGGNYRSIPTDCPQRDERQGWLGDRSIVSRSESFLFDVAAFYTKWHADLCDAQNQAGGIPDVAPTYWTFYNDDVTWPSTFLMVPGMLLDQYGDRRIVQRAYPAMRRWIEHMRGYIQNDLLAKDTYGDWCVPPEDPKLIHSKDPARQTEGTLIATAYFQYLLSLTARYANIAGRNEDAKEYESLSACMRAAFEKKFYHPDRGNYSNGSQTSSLLPLALGITPRDHRAAVLKSLVEKIDRESHDHVGVGLIGAQWLMRTLSKNGQTDLAYRMATQTTYPGWGYMVAKGATTIWELWNGDTADPAMNSGNHVMQIGDLGVWLYSYLGGIQPDPKDPGFHHIIIHPYIPADLHAVRVSHRSMYGLIVSDWKRQNGEFSLHVTIPPNTIALIFVPSAAGKRVTESGIDAARARDVRFVRNDEGNAVFEVGSGAYDFQVRK